MWACGAGNSLKAAYGANKESFANFSQCKAFEIAGADHFWYSAIRSSRDTPGSEGVELAGYKCGFSDDTSENRHGIGMVHLAALTSSIRETTMAKKYMEAKSRERNDNDPVGWNINRDIDNRDRSVEETESATHDARIYVASRGKVCWLVANVGKSRVVKRIEVDNGRVGLRGQVRKVEMEVWADGTANEVAFAELTASKPDKVKHVNDIRWT